MERLISLRVDEAESAISRSGVMIRSIVCFNDSHGSNFLIKPNNKG